MTTTKNPHLGSLKLLIIIIIRSIIFIHSTHCMNCNFQIMIMIMIFFFLVKKQRENGVFQSKKSKAETPKFCFKI